MAWPSPAPALHAAATSTPPAITGKAPRRLTARLAGISARLKPAQNTGNSTGSIEAGAWRRYSGAATMLACTWAAAAAGRAASWKAGIGAPPSRPVREAGGDRMRTLQVGHPPPSPAHPANNHVRTTANAAVASRPRLRVSQ